MTPSLDQPAVEPKLLSKLRWRCIGPPRGGRVVAVAGDVTNPAVFYFGACAGGVWKTDDGGSYWENISDGFFNTSSMGAIAVSESDPNVIYAGTGESTIRVDVSHGDGVYRSTDGGQTWTHVGLEDTRHIGKIRIHPRDPNLVYVAALGHAFGANEERGVFRSKDGGNNWEKILFKSDKAGAVDLTMDPRNPRILFASIWEVYRNFWTISSGGPDSGLYKSTDGGDTWVEVSANKGFPEGIKGKIGISVSPAKTGRIWALVEAEEPGFYRSDDGGESWEKLTDNGDLRARPWYFSHVIADPQDADTVYVLNLRCWKSTDGGATFKQITTPHGDDHDLWIDPNNPQRMIEGNDGGACVSFNGGASWSSIYNQLTAQFYHVAADNQFPYRVYGTQQDNSSISVPSRTGTGAITWQECYPTGTGESGHIAVHPDNPSIVYVGAVGSSPGGGGALQRYDRDTGQIQLVTVWPEIYTGWGAKDLKYRFQWTFPILFSPHDANVLYAAGNHVFRTKDEGHSWEVISPDLTRNDITKLEAAGGPLSKDTSGAEHYATVFAFAESPHEPGVFWAGSDDGLIHISRDGGNSWNNVTPEDLPEWTMISIIEVSPHDPATAYVSATRYKLDDYRPYLYKTSDYGHSWSRIDSGIADNDFTRVIRSDPGRPGLLYAGTETGVYVSFNDGESWQLMRANLPVAPIHDLLIKDNDLIAATHGRSFWILDDLTLLHQLFDEPNQSDLHLFKPRDSYRLPDPLSARWYADAPGKSYHVALGSAATYYQKETPAGELLRTFVDAGLDAPNGVVVHYYLSEEPEGELTLAFVNANGEVIRQFSNQVPESESDSQEEQEPQLPAAAGMNRFLWDLRYEGAHPVPGDQTTSGMLSGPKAAPGRIEVRLTLGGHRQTASFELLPDPRVSATQDEFEEQLALLLRIREKLSETHDGINLLRDTRDQLDFWLKRLEGDHGLMETAERLREKLTSIEKSLIQTSAKYPADRMKFKSRLNLKLASLVSVVESADARPARQAYDVYDHLVAQIDDQLAALRELLDQEVSAFNESVRQLGLPAIVA